MHGITPHLWFDTEAAGAANFYCGIFPDSRITNLVTLPGTPSGDAESVSFELFGQPFQAISAGPLFRFNPSVSFTVACSTPDEIDRYWQTLAEDGDVLMELGTYPFSERYGWVADRYGLSWQFMLDPDRATDQPITPTLLFAGAASGRARDAIDHYTSVFPDTGIDVITTHGPEAGPEARDHVLYASFRLAGQRFAAMDSPLEHDFAFNEAISFVVACDDQFELDRYADALSADPQAEQCGWIKDRFGLSWQLTPTELGEMLANGTSEQIARVTETFLPMKRFDLEHLRRAYRQAAPTHLG